MKHILQSNRLRLIPFERIEDSLFHQINITPFVRKFLWDDEVISLDLAKAIMEQNKNHFKNEGYGLWKILRKHEEEILGYTGLWFFFDEPQPQLLYALLEEHVGQGYATEAAQLIIDYAFAKLCFEYLLAATDNEHIESQKTAKRLGMQFYESKIIEGKPTVFFRLDNI